MSSPLRSLCSFFLNSLVQGGFDGFGKDSEPLRPKEERTVDVKGGACKNALLAADWIVIPVPPEDFGTQGLRMIHQGIEQAQRMNPSLQLVGHLVTRFDSRLLIHRRYEGKLRQLYGPNVLETVIPEASAFKVSLACRQPVAFFSPRSSAARLTSQLGREILDRIAGQTQRTNVG